MFWVAAKLHILTKVHLYNILVQSNIIHLDIYKLSVNVDLQGFRFTPETIPSTIVTACNQKLFEPKYAQLFAKLDHLNVFHCYRIVEVSVLDHSQSLQ